MEFKKRLVQKQKANKVRCREEAGFKRVKVRGRKRWLKTAKPEASKEG